MATMKDQIEKVRDILQMDVVVEGVPAADIRAALSILDTLAQLVE